MKFTDKLQKSFSVLPFLFCSLKKKLTIPPFDKLHKWFSPSFQNLDFSKEKQQYHRLWNYKSGFPPLLKILFSLRRSNISPFDKLQKWFSPSFKNLDFSKEKQQYHRLLNYKSVFPPLLKILFSLRRINISPYDKLQKSFSPSSEKLDISLEKQPYHRLINYKSDFPPLLKILFSLKRSNTSPLINYKGAFPPLLKISSFKRKRNKNIVW